MIQASVEKWKYRRLSLNSKLDQYQTTSGFQIIIILYKNKGEMSSSTTNLFPIKWMSQVKKHINTHLCIECWDTKRHFSPFFTWHALLYKKWVGKIVSFLKADIFIDFIETAAIRNPRISNINSWFILEYQFHSITHTIRLLLYNQLNEQV